MSQALAGAELSVADRHCLIDSATNPRSVLAGAARPAAPSGSANRVDRHPSPRARDLLAARLGFEADLEFGLRDGRPHVGAVLSGVGPSGGR